ncbi:hypothetical protein [Streptosporangium sp. CA-115845]|uniref:hypothetical protein n=1 Tax=Streptosporangium sp. CA-115845 TaxID=3240071 RepID=UPI003D8FFEFA
MSSDPPPVPGTPPVMSPDPEPDGAFSGRETTPSALAEIPAAAPDDAGPGAPHGRCPHCGDPLPRSTGKRARKWCSDRCKNAASRERRATELTTVTTAVTEAGTVLDQARPLHESLRALVASFGEKVDLAHNGALARIATAEREAVEDRADAAVAREQAADADRARITAERRMREAEQAQKKAEEREDSARADLERVGEKARAQVLELGEKLGDARKATELAEGVIADQSNQLRALRTENDELRAAHTAQAADLAERGRQLQAEQNTSAQLRRRLGEQSDQAAALALQLATATADATTAREEILTAHADLERVRQRHEEETQRLRADLESARRQAETGATALVRLQTLHDGAQERIANDQERIADLRGQCEDLKAQREVFRAELGDLRARVDAGPTRLTEQ